MSARLGFNPAIQQRLRSQSGSFVPVLLASTTNPTLGSGAPFAQRGWAMLHDGFVQFTVTLAFGDTGANAGSGTYAIGLPYNPHASLAATDTVATGYIRDASTGDARAASLQANGQIRVHAVTDTVAHNNPWTWASTDRLTFTGGYPVAT